jgi:hypothetical protein
VIHGNRRIDMAGYDEQWDFCEGLAAVRSGNMWGFIDEKGRIVVTPQFYWVSSFSEGFAAVCDDSTLQGYIGKDGNYLIKPKYGFAKPFMYGLGEVKSEGRYGVVDRTGREIVPVEYDDVDRCEGGFTIVELDGKYGLFDKAGKKLLEPACDSISVEGGKAKYEKDGKEGELKL